MDEKTITKKELLSILNLTKETEGWLREHRLLARFKRNYADYWYRHINGLRSELASPRLKADSLAHIHANINGRSSMRILQTSFLWNETPEGWDYWTAIWHKRWRETTTKS